MINHIKISRNFFLDEFQCNGEDCCGGVVKLQPKALSCIQKVRCCIQKPVIINSGYRCPKHDKEIGGKGNHPRGDSLDWWAEGMTPKEMLAVAEYCGFTGLGEGINFVHTDTGKKRRWRY